MIRIVKMSNKYYGIEIDSIEDDLENIKDFIDQGTPVILVNDLEDLEFTYGISEDEIILVEPE